MKFGKLFKMAISSIISNKMRSFLTMLGIIIGISSVIVLVGLGQGTQKQISDQIEKLGTNLITINVTGNRNVSITDADIADLLTKPGIKQIAPALSQGSVNIKNGSTSDTTTLEASTPAYSEIRKITVASGRFITSRDIENRFKVAVIGSETATNLFNTTNVVGQTMYVNGIEFSIIGVLQTEGSSSTGSSDDRIIVPLSTAERLLKTTNIKTFYVEATSKDTVEEAKSYLTLFMNKKLNSDTTAYRVFDQTSLLTTATTTTQSMTTMLSGIAAISLLVGGIGIMNIMLVSVIERTREIGIRKAIGATTSAILLQFLTESVIISLIGGIIGMIIGILGAYAIGSFANITPSLSPIVVIGAILFSSAVGIFFGIYPARKAANLHPIDALRYE